MNQGGQDYAYLYDGKANVEVVIDASQNVVAGYRYDPFGILLNQTGSLTQPYMFSTKRYDAQTGLIHYEFRDYIPALARWTTRDPLGEAGGLNLYAFVGNNPINWVDPWGFMTQELVWRPVFEGIKVKLPSLAGYLTGVSTSTLVSGVSGGLVGVIGNMVFAPPVGETLEEIQALHADAAEAAEDACPVEGEQDRTTQEHDRRNKEQIKGDIDDFIEKEAEILKDWPDQPLGRTRGRIKKWLKDWTKR